MRWFLHHCGLYQPVRWMRTLTVLGIETSCDDTAVCVMRSDKKVLSSRRYADRLVQQRLGGVCPAVVAEQHRTYINRFVDDCLEESKLRLSDLDGIAVTTTPGLVIALRVGVSTALSLARRARIAVIPVHHIRAHATIATFLRDIEYPYVTVLISGAHAIIAIAKGANSFEQLLTCSSGSPGECLDKIGRELQLDDELDVLPGGAALEITASRATTTGRYRYPIDVSKFVKLALDFNFSWIKSSYLRMLMKNEPCKTDFCASVQHSVASYLGLKLQDCLRYINDNKKISARKHFVVVSGGVASNNYILNTLREVSSMHKYELWAPPAKYCCDNAEMIAWNGLQKMMERAEDIISPQHIPAQFRVSERSPIGVSVSEELRTYLGLPERTVTEQAMRNCC